MQLQPERRQHVRILTIKNFGRAALVLLVVIAAANIISEMRPSRSGEYGRLTIKAEPVSVKQPEVVTESEVPDETPIVPPTSLLSVAPAPPPAQVVQGSPEPAPLSRTTGPVTIVGGADGIHVETAKHDATPKLSGGIFRQ